MTSNGTDVGNCGYGMSRKLIVAVPLPSFHLVHLLPLTTLILATYSIAAPGNPNGDPSSPR